MDRGIVRTLGVIAFLVGIFLFINSFSGLTGLAVLEEEVESVVSLLAVGFIIAGVALMVIGRRGKDRVVKIEDSGTSMHPPKEFSNWIKNEESANNA